MSGLAHCEGACPKHAGPLRRVRVWHGSKDWGVFTYCQVAIATDRGRGFLVADPDTDEEIGIVTIEQHEARPGGEGE